MNVPSRAEWGPVVWKVVHWFAVTYPEHVTEEDRKRAVRFFQGLADWLWCPDCRTHFAQLLGEFDLNQQAESRKSLLDFTHELHNRVNRRLKKREITRQEFYKAYGGPPPKPRTMLPNTKPESSKAESSKAESSKAERGKPESSKAERGKAERSKPESSKAESSRGRPESSKPESKVAAKTSQQKQTGPARAKAQQQSSKSAPAQQAKPAQGTKKAPQARPQAQRSRGEPAKQAESDAKAEQSRGAMANRVVQLPPRRPAGYRSRAGCASCR